MNNDVDKTKEQLIEEVKNLRKRVDELEKAKFERKKTEKERKQLLHDIGERIKELQCLYGVAESISKRETLEEIFQDIVEIIPPSWHYPEITRGKIIFDGKEYVSEEFEETNWNQSSEIVVNDEYRGKIEVYYLEKRPQLDEGPFMKEERNLINSLAQSLSVGIERKQAEEKLLEYSNHLEELVDERTKKLKETQEQLSRREKLAAAGQLASAVAHEIRNPLGVIANSVFYLNSKIKYADEKVQKHLGILQREVRRANKIISNLLDFSKDRSPSFKKENVNSIIKVALADIEIPENISVETNLDVNVPPLQLDPDQIRQVFLNIILNAIQAMPEGGVLGITTTAKDDLVKIMIRDTGRGIPEENLKKIFQPLFTTRAKGIGLGLPIVDRIIKNHNGKIKIKSESGKGTLFMIMLPLKKEKC